MSVVEIEAMHVERDDNGYWFHHDVNWDAIGEEPFGPYFKALGYEVASTYLQDKVDEDVEPLRSYLAGETNITAWEPTPPTGDGWVLVAICDSEDGPFAYYIRGAR
jgi:hypothetical protein